MDLIARKVTQNFRDCRRVCGRFFECFGCGAKIYLKIKYITQGCNTVVIILTCFNSNLLADSVYDVTLHRRTNQ